MRPPQRRTRRVQVRGLGLGGDEPVRVQAMTKTDTRDTQATLVQIRAVEVAGAEIIRLAVPDQESVASLARLRPHTDSPLVADVHFDHRLAIAALEAGADKVRLNPGNIPDPARLRQVVEAAKGRGAPIRIGINSGSLPMRLVREHGGPTSAAMVAAAVETAALFEEWAFSDIVVSLKSSSVTDTIEANQLLARQVDYPIHLGVTAAGPLLQSAVRSSLALGPLLMQGIGDTIRVSVTGDPGVEVEVAWEILQALGLRRRGALLVSCPTCARTRHPDLPSLVERIKARLQQKEISSPLTVAIMGCEVNGPGEAREADVGIALSKTGAHLFRQGRVIAHLPLEHAEDALLAEVDRLSSERAPRGD